MAHYAQGDKCEGNFYYTEKGVWDCTNPFSDCTSDCIVIRRNCQYLFVIHCNNYCNNCIIKPGC